MSDEAKCAPKVLKLIEHLRETGTGEDKLTALLKLGERCSKGKKFNDEQFMELLPKTVPAGTLKKALAYIEGDKKSPLDDDEPPPAPPADDKSEKK